MGLSGNLEDMPLQDILQIIHHSKKSGTLFLNRGGEAGTIAFKEGAIVQCFAPSERKDLGDALIEAGRITRATLEAAVAAQVTASQAKRLGSILVERGDVRFEDIEAVVKRQIQLAAAQLLAWQDGTFNLVLEEMPSYDTIALALEELALPQGMDTQHLLLEALRTWDEEGRDAAAAEAEATQAATEGGAGPKPEQPDEARRRALRAPVVVVSGDRAMGAAITNRLAEEGHAVEATTEPEDCLELVPLLATGDLRPIVLLDPAALPEPDPFLASLRQRAPKVAIVAIETAPGSATPEFRASFRRAGGGRVLVRAADDVGGGRFLDALAPLVSDVAEGGARAERESEEMAASAEADEVRRQLEELRAQREAATMALTLLRIVARRFERAIFFCISDAYLVPLGAFGKTSSGESVARIAREMAFAPHPGSVLDEVQRAGSAREVDLSESDLSSPILDRIGWPASGSACLLPLATGGRTVALLYADQGQGEAPIGSLTSLEPLLAQAARSLESILDATVTGGAP